MGTLPRLLEIRVCFTKDMKWIYNYIPRYHKVILCREGKLKPLTRADAGDKQVNVSPANTMIAASRCGYELRRPRSIGYTTLQDERAQIRKHGGQVFWGLSRTDDRGRRLRSARWTRAVDVEDLDI